MNFFQKLFTKHTDVEETNSSLDNVLKNTRTLAILECVGELQIESAKLIESGNWIDVLIITHAIAKLILLLEK